MRILSALILTLALTGCWVTDKEVATWAGEAGLCDVAIDARAVDATTWYADVDADGYGGPDGFGGEETFFMFCEDPGRGFSSNVDDCDDEHEEAHPGAEESCGDTLDNDCDGDVDGEDEDCPGTGNWSPGGSDGSWGCFCSLARQAPRPVSAAWIGGLALVTWLRRRRRIPWCPGLEVPSHSQRL